jgi:hypothetical protein
VITFSTDVEPCPAILPRANSENRKRAEAMLRDGRHAAERHRGALREALPPSLRAK